jgi:hypothetical protein
LTVYKYTARIGLTRGSQRSSCAFILEAFGGTKGILGWVQ